MALSEEYINGLPTANVVVSFSEEPILRLFESGGSTKSLLQTLTKNNTEDLILFNHESNPNFISFEYQFTLGGGQHVATLKFIDPEGEFEKRYFSKDIFENIAGFQFDLGDIGYALQSEDPNKFETPLAPSTPEEEQAQRSEFMTRYIQEYNQRHIYVAFGSGYNTETWAGPYKMYMMGATVDGSKGKVITLKLYPTPEGFLPGDRRSATNRIVNLRLNGLYCKTTGYSEQINIGLDRGSSDPAGGSFDRLYDIVPYVVNPPDSDTTSTVLEAFQTDQLENTKAATMFYAENNVFPGLGTFNFHDIVVDCIKDYIMTATGKRNVIVLLPNLNLLMLEYIETEAKKVLKEANLGAAGSAPPIGIGAMATSLFPPIRNATVQQKFLFHNIIQTILEGIGIELLETPIEGTGSTPAERKRDRYDSIPSHKILRLDPYSDAEDNFIKKFEYTNYFAGISTESSNLIPDHKKTLGAVEMKLKSAMNGRYPFEPIIFTENNRKILSAWGEVPAYSHYRTFGGKGVFNPRDEAIIYGDKGLIKNFLYARKDQIPRTPFDEFLDSKTITNLRDKNKELSKKIARLEEQYVIAVQADSPDAVTLSEEINVAKKKKELVRWSGINEFVQRAGNNLLAPVDRSILNQQYLEGFRKRSPGFFNEKIVKGTPFGSLYDAPEEYSIGVSQLDDSEVAEIHKGGIEKEAVASRFPIFKYNTRNPNVTELRSDVSLAYLAALRIGFSKMISRRAANVVIGQLKSEHATLQILSTEEAIAFLYKLGYATAESPEEKQYLLDELTKRMSETLVEDFNHYESEALDDPTLFTANPPPHRGHSIERGPHESSTYRVPQSWDYETVAEKIAAVVEVMARLGNTPKLLIDQDRPGDPTSIMASLMSDAYRRALNVTIKTTPLFHLSDVGSAILNNCILYAKDPPIIRGPEDLLFPADNLFNNFLSGVYQILGFKHTIDAKGVASSEFSLVGGPVSSEIKDSPQSSAFFDE